MIRDYRGLEVWNEAMQLVIRVYGASQKFPQHELNGLTGQLRRAVISIPCHIAEGRCRSFNSEFMEYLSLAWGSLAEVETYLSIAARLGYLGQQNEADLITHIELVEGMLMALKTSGRKERPCQPVH